MIPEYSTWVKCPFCNIKTEPNIDRLVDPHPMHGYRKTCAQCGRQIGWTGKPDQDKPKRPAAHRKLVKARGVDYCELCLIRASALPVGETLEGHHIEQYADGGDHEVGNAMTVCTACHSLIHWRRTYVGHLVGKDNQHHAQRGTDTGDVAGAQAVGELEATCPRREADKGSDATDRDAGKLDGPSDLEHVRCGNGGDDAIPF